VCAGALSWCRIQSPSRHFSTRFRRTDSRKRRKTSRTVSLLLLRTIILSLAIISSFLDVDGRPERRSLSTEVLHSLNRRNQSNTRVRSIASSPNACCNNWYVSVRGFPIVKQNLMQMRCSVLSHIVKIAMTQTHVLFPRPTAANWANAATCNLCHVLLRYVRTCQDWLQTHPIQWTTTTIPIRILLEQTSYKQQLHIVHKSYLWQNLAEISLEFEMFQTKFVEKIKIHTLRSITSPSP